MAGVRDEIHEFYKVHPPRSSANTVMEESYRYDKPQPSTHDVV